MPRKLALMCGLALICPPQMYTMLGCYNGLSE
jgi:hypothetical protein